MTRRTALLLWGSGLLLTGLALALWVALRSDVFAIDAWFASVLPGLRSEPWLWISYALDQIGGGVGGVFIVPILIALMLVLMRRGWGALYFLVAEIASAALVQVVKTLVARDRPVDMIVVSDFGSFPSGHAANAATVVFALLVLFPRAWLAVLGAIWVVAMGLSRMLLGAHWLSDTAGGVLLGASVSLLLAAAFLPLLERRREDRLSP